MKFTAHDRKVAQDKLQETKDLIRYGFDKDDPEAARKQLLHAEQRLALIENWFIAKKERRLQRKLRKSPTPMQPSVKPTPIFNEEALPEPQFMISLALQILKDEGITDCPVGLCNRRASYFHYTRSFYGDKMSINFSQKNITYYMHSDTGMIEYACAKKLIAPYKNTRREALRLVVIHEVAHAVDYDRNNRKGTHHHQVEWRAIYKELLAKYAQLK